MAGSSPNLMTLRIISFALLMSTVIYVGVCFVAVPLQVPSEPGSLTTIRLGLTIAGGVTLLSIPMMRKIGRKGRAVGPAALLHGVEPAPPDEAKAERHKAMSALMVSTIMGMAMAEAVVIYGLVLAFVSADPYLVLPFFAVGFVAMALQWPRESMVDRLMSDGARTALRR